MKKNIIRLFPSLLVLALISCSPQSKTAGNYSYKTECMGVELDGSQTVKAWGNGRNREDAIEQAKKNAVRDVLFKGITEGRQDCEKRPLVPEVNAQMKYESYFNKFFADGGEYKTFVSMKDQRGGATKMGARESVTFGVVLRILRSDLKQKLITDGILTK